MHEKRNFAMILMLVACIGWAVWAWLFRPGEQADTGAVIHKSMSLLMLVSLAIWLVYAMKFEDKLPDHLRQTIGPVSYEADGVSFVPTIRVRGKQAELCLYYQNRFENTADCIVHLRPPPPPNSFIIQPEFRDVHFAFRCDGGDFGAIHQPIGVPRSVQGEVIEVQVAASSWYPRSHGDRLRSEAGMPCGTLAVDWAGNPLKVGVHEVSSEMPLTNPLKLHLAMPANVSESPPRASAWRQERLASGAAELSGAKA